MDALSATIDRHSGNYERNYESDCILEKQVEPIRSEDSDNDEMLQKEDDSLAQSFASIEWMTKQLRVFDDEMVQKENDSLAQSFASIEWMTKQLRVSIERDAEILEEKKSSSMSKIKGIETENRFQDGQKRMVVDNDSSMAAALRILNQLSEEDSSSSDGVDQASVGDRILSNDNNSKNTQETSLRTDKSVTDLNCRTSKDTEANDARNLEQHVNEGRMPTRDLMQVNEDQKRGVAEKKSNNQGQQDWLEAYTANGRVYYYNKYTRESSWKRPDFEPQSTCSVTQAQHDSDLCQPKTLESIVEVDKSKDRTNEEILAQSGLYCCFCGQYQDPIEKFEDHFAECLPLKLHKAQMTPMYQSFQRMLCVLSEDHTLRALHYASACPDPRPQNPSKSVDAKSVTKSLTLLKNFQDARNISPERKDTGTTRRRKSTTTNPVVCQSSTVQKSSRRKTVNGVILKDSYVPLEICRHCKRKFAPGRLEKHEAVCPRIFGAEGAWGKPNSSKESSRPISQPVKSERLRFTDISNKQEKPSDKSKAMRNSKQSYKEHQSTLVICPCCKRKFAPNGAQEHISICKDVQHRPKNTVSHVRNFAVAG
ncbi:unnamed protein product [Albugo candida]|uniref:Uncharacterized protein n=1 Tax=Albugo candida TaxID=65357 RepID=A0A024GVK0_9STRA|nr:unnamed protein product [Albugo candida]|eukprot:CCI50668.1 unnamed protein product [Albugo candida]